MGPVRPAKKATLPASLSQEAAAAQRTASSSSSSASNVAQAMQQAAAIGVDIAPGIYSPTGIAPEMWEELLVLPGDVALNKYLWNLGRRDAQTWARATGLEAAAAAKKANSGANKAAYSQG